MDEQTDVQIDGHMYVHLCAQMDVQINAQMQVHLSEIDKIAL